jgi:hypothetical protein
MRRPGSVAPGKAGSGRSRCRPGSQCARAGSAHIDSTSRRRPCSVTRCTSWPFETTGRQPILLCCMRWAASWTDSSGSIVCTWRCMTPRAGTVHSCCRRSSWAMRVSTDEIDAPHEITVTDQADETALTVDDQHVPDVRSGHGLFDNDQLLVRPYGEHLGGHEVAAVHIHPPHPPLHEPWRGADSPAGARGERSDGLRPRSFTTHGSRASSGASWRSGGRGMGRMRPE